MEVNVRISASGYVTDMPGTLRALCIKYSAKAAARTVSVQVPSLLLPRCLAQADVSCISYMTTLLFLVLDEKTTKLAKHCHEKGLGQFLLPVQ